MSYFPTDIPFMSDEELIENGLKKPEIIKDTDLVSVVRCKDCKHLYKDGECPLRTWYIHVEEDFCSYGERREE